MKKPDTSSKLTGYILAIIGSMCYGLNPLFALPLYDTGLRPLSVLFYRYVIAAAMIAVMMLLKRESFSLTKKEALLSGAMGLFFGVSSCCLFYSFKYMDAGIASTILFTYPLFVAVIMWAFFHEKAGAATWGSLGLALCGIGLLYKTDGQTLSTVGIVLVLLSSLTYALYLIGVNRSVLHSMPALKLTFYASISGAMLFIILMRGGYDLQPLTGAVMWRDAIGLALFPTFLSMVLVTKAIHTIGSTPASIIGALEPITALAVTMLVFGSRLTIANAFGVALILSAVILVVSAGGRKS